jgi:hypothetical protein
MRFDKLERKYVLLELKLRMGAIIHNPITKSFLPRLSILSDLERKPPQFSLVKTRIEVH